MAKQTINLGTGELTGDGESIRSAFDKVNDNFDEVYTRDLNTDAQTLSVNGDVISISGGNSITIAPTVSLDGDLTGSVFGDDSALLVDGVNNKIVGPVDTASLRTSELTIALGALAGETNQGLTAVAIGGAAGYTDQSTGALAVGYGAGYTGQGVDTVAVGKSAGRANQGVSAVAVGESAGYTTQSANAVALGFEAGKTTQGNSAVAIGKEAGETTQGTKAVAIGSLAGKVNQGNEAVALGNLAGFGNQAANSIIINATGTMLDNIVADTFVVKPVRNAVGTTIMMYDAGTGEVTHSSTIAGSLDGDITGSVFGDDSTVLVDGVNNKIVGNIDTASLRTSELTIALGRQAGQTNQGVTAVAVGYAAGRTDQGTGALAVGYLAGDDTQGLYATSIGPFAGVTRQGARASAIGIVAGYRDQGTYAVALGAYTGSYGQGSQATAVGYGAGYYGQSLSAVAIGYKAGRGINVFKNYVSGGVGSTTLVVDNTSDIVAGMELINSIAYKSGQTVVSVDSGTSLTISAVADGTPSSGSSIQFSSGGQGELATAIGGQAGEQNQGNHAVAIGNGAGLSNQGERAIAIGYQAGKNNQAVNSIVINATSAVVENTTADSFVVKPVRNATMTTILGYDAGTGEVTHNAVIPGYTNTADLKALVAASTDFADYQTRIAAL